MGLRAAVDLIALLVCSGYGTIPLFWIVVHPFAHRWRKRGRRAYFFILPAWAGVIASVFRIMWPFRFAHLYVNWFAWAPAAMFFLLGFSIYSAAFRASITRKSRAWPSLNRANIVSNWSPPASVRACGILFTSGTFASSLAGVSVQA